jgi:hypothetical protein
MTSSSAGEALPSVYTTRPGEALPRWLCAELAQLDRASVYETEGRRFDSCIPRHPPFFLTVSSRLAASAARNVRIWILFCLQ